MVRSANFNRSILNTGTGPSAFGAYGPYMRAKRAKLQNQNDTIGTNHKSDIMKGVAIYVSSIASEHRK
jgi:hypothetical protein